MAAAVERELTSFRRVVGCRRQNRVCGSDPAPTSGRGLLNGRFKRDTIQQHPGLPRMQGIHLFEPLGPLWMVENHEQSVLASQQKFAVD